MMQEHQAFKYNHICFPSKELRWLSFQEMMMGLSGKPDCIATQMEALWPLKLQWTQRIEDSWLSQKLFGESLGLGSSDGKEVSWLVGNGDEKGGRRDLV